MDARATMLQAAKAYALDWLGLRVAPRMLLNRSGERRVVGTLRELAFVALPNKHLRFESLANVWWSDFVNAYNAVAVPLFKCNLRQTLAIPNRDNMQIEEYVHYEWTVDPRLLATEPENMRPFSRKLWDECQAAGRWWQGAVDLSIQDRRAIDEGPNRLCRTYSYAKGPQREPFSIVNDWDYDIAEPTRGYMHITTYWPKPPSSVVDAIAFKAQQALGHFSQGRMLHTVDDYRMFMSRFGPVRFNNPHFQWVWDDYVCNGELRMQLKAVYDTFT